MADYTSPAMRGDNPSPQSNAELVSQNEISAHYWPTTSTTPSGPFHGKTLHDCAATPGRLSHILLYHNANPRWSSDKIIYTKSGLDLLPKPAGDDGIIPKPSEPSELSETDPAGPIAIFEQATHAKGPAVRAYKFTGYFRVSRVAFLEPDSPELVRMLEQKWQRTDRFGNVGVAQRGGEKWRESLSQRWAVVKLEELEGVGGRPGVEELEDPVVEEGGLGEVGGGGGNAGAGTAL